MITSLNLGTNGRLGNQLFQYAALKAVGLENNYEVRIPNPNSANWHGQACLLDNFNVLSNFLTFEDIATIKYWYTEKDHTKLDLSFFTIEDHTTLSGFFQSLKYFEKYKDQIFKELTPKKEFMKQAEEYMKQFDKDKPVVSIHVRRGDNTDGINPNMMTSYTPDGYYFKYLQKAVKLFDDCTFLVFTGGSRTEGDNREDIEWCKDNLNIEAHYSEGSTMEDFSRILCCDHSILGQASSFGLFAGYLNVENGKTVVAPSVYDPTSSKPHSNREGLYHPNFKVLCK
tara:strand:- start:830 stop:1681 length:852 start_codon:yes stop_codon:yes gene_type:complete